MSKYQRRASWLQTGPFPPPEAERQAGDSKSQKARGNGLLHQTVSRLPVANQVFLGSWMVDICQEGHSQRSAPKRRTHMAYLRWSSCSPLWKLSGWDQGGD